MTNSAKQAQDNTQSAGSVSVLAAVGGAFCNKYVVISLISAALAAAALPLGSDSLFCITEVSAAALICLAMWLIQSFALRKYGISRKMMLDNQKSVDPRLSGSLGDLNSLGSSLGALAGISVVLSRLFIADGGVFDSDNIAVPLLETLACALCTGSMISVTTSRPSLRYSLYIIAGRTTGAGGSELLKKTCRASNSPELMRRLGKMSCVRVAAAVVISMTIVMSALSGAGPVFCCAQTAFLCMLAVGLSGSCPNGGEDKLSDEKIPLFSKKSKNLCALNIFAYILIVFFFIFSFPFRSVYTDYTPKLEYDYDEVVSESVEIFSIPQSGDESMMLFNGVFLACALMIAVISGVFALVRGFSSVSQISSELLGSVASAAAAAGFGLIVKSAALDSVQYLVAASTACLLILVNLIAYLVGQRRKG
ncbi:MAG: hypothetical protein ACI4J0_08365 [Huintestinicola sp.]|uniref:hypothetical protein n=1 Tax=Huintestinicola sp. TaxID=2981661 RepID=UPI003EFFC333